ncbi:hypothetical protein M885DRAFT_622959, partial [Pelagophyceae sp. CCMP2097]
MSKVVSCASAFIFAAARSAMPARAVAFSAALCARVFAWKNDSTECVVRAASSDGLGLLRAASAVDAEPTTNAAAVQTAMAGLAAGQTGPAEPAASQADASGGVSIGSTAPDAAATLPPTEPVRPATPPRRLRAEQQSRTPKSGASFLNYKTLVDKEYRVAGESARAPTTMVIFPDDAEKLIRACQMDPADVKDLSSSG